MIGELVMEALRGLDPVAYVRFASVYRDFREAADFQEVLGEIAAEPATATKRLTSPRELRCGDGAAQETLSVMRPAERSEFDAHMMQIALASARGARAHGAQSGRRRRHRR